MEYIAEIGANWYMDKKMDVCFEKLKVFVKELADTGVDYIKFQAWDTPKFIHPEHPDYNKFKKYELPSCWYAQLITLCKKLDVKFMTSAFDADTADVLHELGQHYWKIASGEVTNIKLIEHIAKYNQEMFVSTGNANEYEIKKVVESIRRYNNAPLTIFHCISKYPTKLNELGLRRLITLDAQYPHCDLGWSNHVAPKNAAIAGAAALALGVDVIETHVRPDGVATPDSGFAMTTKELSDYMTTLDSIDQDEPVIDEHELLWARRGEDGLRPWINWEVRDGK